MLSTTFSPSPWQLPAVAAAVARLWNNVSDTASQDTVAVSAIPRLILWAGRFFVGRSYAGDGDGAIKAAVAVPPSGTLSTIYRPMFPILSYSVSTAVVPIFPYICCHHHPPLTPIILNIFCCTRCLTSLTHICFCCLNRPASPPPSTLFILIHSSCNLACLIPMYSSTCISPNVLIYCSLNHLASLSLPSLLSYISVVSLLSLSPSSHVSSNDALPSCSPATSLPTVSPTRPNRWYQAAYVPVWSPETPVTVCVMVTVHQFFLLGAPHLFVSGYISNSDHTRRNASMPSCSSSHHFPSYPRSSPKCISHGILFLLCLWCRCFYCSLIPTATIIITPSISSTIFHIIPHLLRPPFHIL